MRICSIASGSSGNCTYIGSDTTHILIDAGISCKRIVSGVESLGVSMKDISAIFITHEHSDHICGLSVLSKKYGLPIYTLPGTKRALLSQQGASNYKDLVHELAADERFILKDLRILPFHTSHDAAEPAAYVVQCEHKRAAVCTDLGEYTEYTVENLKNLDAMVLESNHDVHMLEVGPYPYYLKRRILGKQGHLSNESCGNLLCRILNDHLKGIFLGHLSKENNLPILALESVRAEITTGENPYVGSELPIFVAKRDEVTEALEF